MPAMPSPATTSGPETLSHTKDLSAVLPTLGVIALIIAMLGLGLAYGLSAWLHQAPPGATTAGNEPTVTRTLVGKTLSIPASWLRDAGGSSAGFSSAVDFTLRLPLGENGALAAIEVTLLPLSQARPSASLLDGVYLHAFMPEQLAGPPGLVGKPLRPEDGFENETVWYDAVSQNPFVAKCDAPPDGSGSARCLRTVALPDGIAAVYAFDTGVLEQWQAFDPDMAGWLTRIGAM